MEVPRTGQNQKKMVFGGSKKRKTEKTKIKKKNEIYRNMKKTDLTEVSRMPSGFAFFKKKTNNELHKQVVETTPQKS